MALYFDLTRCLAVCIMLFVVITNVSSTCDCDPHEDHPQIKFCGSSFAIRGKVMAVEERNEGLERPIRYLVKIHYVYKGFDFLPEESVWISTDDLSTCGQRLEKKMYFLSGLYSRSTNTFEITACGMNKEYQTLTLAELRGINGSYDCRCGVRYVTEPGIWRLNRPNVCYLNDSNRYCLNILGNCHYKNGKCTWKGQDVETCLQD